MLSRECPVPLTALCYVHSLCLVRLILEPVGGGEVIACGVEDVIDVGEAADGLVDLLRQVVDLLGCE
jgi:hypothetical protein